ncbi:hypothetical protein [Spirosoma fluviale]|uniref:Yip1 domain-containing protein n=1 Tax=Spirosoma fluviale TaxID=1597977 RepID=A0A286F8L1_9BACT|nr:hypothetical protein [Spirosoma fluviale]SOD79446.1 hypothetical protein SAMN06269250_0962 [Spirosoma fluviale]
MHLSNTLSLQDIEKPPSENGWLLFAAITVVSLLLTFSGQHLLLSDELYFNALAEQMTYEQIQKAIAQNHEWSWLAYIIIPIFNLLKFSLVAACISLGYYFAADRWVFKSFFRVAIQAELVLLLPSVIKLIWFLFVQPDYSLQDLQYFYPLSVLNFFEPTAIAPWLAYPLQLGNLFELAYWLVLAYGVSQVIETPMPKAFGLVAASYGSGLLVWVVFVMFLTVSLS